MQGVKHGIGSSIDGGGREGSGEYGGVRGEEEEEKKEEKERTF